jgi:Uri superfamily endonuclease
VSAGTYALILRAPEPARIRVGSLGPMEVLPGPHVYVGSAFGPGGLAARVGRHVRGDGRVRWHVDHLRAVAEVEGAWITTDPVRREHLWAEVFRAWPGATVPLAGFGASDCSCETHLVRLRRRPSLARFRRVVAARDRTHAAVVRFPAEKPDSRRTPGRMGGCAAPRRKS